MRGFWYFILLVLLGASGLRFSHSSHSDLTTATNSNSTSSHSLAITADGSILCVANQDSDSLSLVDTHSSALLTEIPVGDDPRSVAIGDMTAYVSNHGSDSISIIDLEAKIHVVDLPVGDRPMGIALSPDGRFLAVAEMGQDTLRVIETGTRKTLVVYPVSDRPYGLSFTPGGDSLLVSHLLSGEITRISVRPYSSYLPSITNNPQLFAPVLHQQTQTGQHQNGSSLHGLGTIIPTWTNIAPAPAVLVNANGSRAFLPQTMGNGQGMNTQFDTTVFPLVSVIDLDSNIHLKSENISLPETDRPIGLPWDLALLEESQELWIVNAASDDISVIDLSIPQFPTGEANIKVSHNPRAIVFSPEGKSAYVHNTLAGTVSVIDTGTYTVTGEIITTNIPLPPLLLAGKQLFHSSGRPDIALAAWISCSTCHIEGEQDGRSWFVQYLGEVPPGEQPIIKRNTTSLLGMLETYPLRWSGEWDESADSEFSIRFEQFGSGLIAGEMHPTLGTPNQGRSAELDSLAAFIDSLQVPERVHTLSPAELRGKLLFESPLTECLVCHPPPLYTDLQQHDVGTGDKPGEWFGPKFDTPGLRYLFDSAPYLHDGSSPTLLHLLTAANPGDQHGLTSQLSEQEINDLIEYLLALPYQ